MNRKIILFIFILILLIVGYYIYENYEKPKEVNYYNVSISTREGFDLLKTGLEINGIKYNTSNSYETFLMQEGINTINTFNILNQNYYTISLKPNITKNMRLDLKLEKYKPVKIEKSGLNPIVLELSSEDFREVDFCLESSLAYLFVEPLETEFYFVNLTNFQSGGKIIRKSEYLKDYEKFEEYSKFDFKKTDKYLEIDKKDFNYDKCYDGEFSLKNGKIKEIKINYLEFSKKTSDDYIKIILIDKENNKIEKVIK